MRRKLYEKQMEEEALKQARKADGLKQLNEWRSQFDNDQSSARQKNLQEAEDQQNLNNELKNNSNSWARVVDNCEMNPDHYAGDHDVSRMRQVMIARKADINKQNNS